MQELITHIQYSTPLAPESIEGIQKAFKKEEIPKNTDLLQERQYCKKLYFIKKGLVRTFYYFQGNDVSSWFYYEGFFFTSWYSFYSQKPSIENIVTMEDCEVFSIHYDSYQRLLHTYKDFERFGRILAEEQLSFLDEYSKGYMFLSAKERYDLLLSYFPSIELRVKVIDIASFLGITRETLSRIRSGKMK